MAHTADPRADADDDGVEGWSIGRLTSIDADAGARGPGRQMVQFALPGRQASRSAPAVERGRRHG